MIYTCNADWNAAQNIGQWLGKSCPLSLKKAVSVMGMDDSEVGINDSPSTNELFKQVDLSGV
ncbi:MAG: hypothetical protein F6K54_37280 [Okeania sp. SIO3B5]|uniref:hypothetical protein n=1 Tax=Okeania sp. SIO3B5 TaxID=2607811 RepID=UPI00140026C9|nr:hypothetical protein [Okeania sp. SIO3B5]NEO58214.1 hypothetical protein [Okeania sp. SIO3B5]